MMGSRAGDKRSKTKIKDKAIDYAGKYTSSIFGILASQPLDTVKVRMQTFPTMYRGMLDCMSKIVKRDKIKHGLYAGTTPALLGGVLDNTVFWLGYSTSQTLMLKLTGHKNPNDMNMASQASVWCLTSFFSSFYACPTELIKCQLQVYRELMQKMHRAGIRVADVGAMDLARCIVYQHTYRGLFCGLNLTLAREMSGALIFFSGYEATIRCMTRPGESRNDVGWMTTMAAVTNGGLFLWALIYPLDVIKSRVQVLSTKRTLYDVTKEIIKREGNQVYQSELYVHLGYSALYNGLKPTLARTIASTVVFYATYEYSKRIFYYFWP